jgi:hypothetical protein
MAGDGAGRRPVRAIQRRAVPLPGVTEIPDMGGPVQQQESGQRGDLAERPASEGALEIARRLGGRCRNIVAEGLLARACSTAGGSATTRSRRVKPGHHLRAAVGHGRAGHLRALPHGRSDRELVLRLVGDVRAARAGDAGRVGLLVPRLDGRLQLRARDPDRALPSRAHRRRAVGRRLAVRGGAASSAARPSSTGRPTAASGRATATARPTSRPRPTTCIPAPATIAGSRSRASRTPSGVR